MGRKIQKRQDEGVVHSSCTGHSRLEELNDSALCYEMLVDASLEYQCLAAIT